MLRSKITLKRLFIFIGGAAILYYILSVFLTHNHQHQHATRRQLEESNTKPFHDKLPKHVSLVNIKPLAVIPPLQMYTLQSQQCEGTLYNRVSPRKKRDESDPWPNFSPSTFAHETNFIKWLENNGKYWKGISRGLDGEELNTEKLKLNNLGFTLNGHLTPKEGHLPIWLKAFKRRSPLDISLAAICQIDDISDTILYVTIDGGDFDEVLEELVKVTCVKIKVYFHPYLTDMRSLGMDKLKQDIGLILNSHYIYGMYMLTQKLDYPYVITLEDDLEASPDFYRYHYSLYHLVYGKEANYYDSKKIFAITAFTQGSTVDCHFLVDKLKNDKSSKCGIHSVHQLVEEDYFPGWGSGITREIFMEYYSQWKVNGRIYDYGMSQLRVSEQRYTLVPCSPRVRTIANEGVNGGNAGRWDHYLTHYAKWDEQPLDRIYYVDRMDGAVKAEEKGNFMYNQIV
ncbi:predicted protein [Naegleria gruberi]|uniref:alpha-1,3-mannosyl-glycoprotein 2-beta-N-acetylglucosaminyltransferase n=1 Tax=Naegleria gruberi TaxID=5762 RepID=D2W3C2_NAEGR|nr:uncharacterized protein NAEGRDRAFT_54391 [Naegleria gruberi]EFC36390.1 predicted protein [Naegleria gruberi]|eukprot:XP_002669134.1 predicted protein [Naegleria gruberi strain NEG-M]